MLALATMVNFQFGKKRGDWSFLLLIPLYLTWFEQNIIVPGGNLEFLCFSLRLHGLRQHFIFRSWWDVVMPLSFFIISFTFLIPQLPADTGYSVKLWTFFLLALGNLTFFIVDGKPLLNEEKFDIVAGVTRKFEFFCFFFIFRGVFWKNS